KAADRPPLPRLHPLLRILRRRQWPRRRRCASGMDLPGRQVAPAAPPGVKCCLLVVARGRIFLRLEEREILLVSLLLQLLDRDESQGRRVHAVALTGRRRPVIEHVAQVRVAVRRTDLGTLREESPVDLLANVVRIERPSEARPTGAGIVLVERAEQRLAGDDIDVNAGVLVVPVLVVKRRLGTLLLRHLELRRRQVLAELRLTWLLVVHLIPSFPLPRRWSGLGCGVRVRGCRRRTPQLRQALVAATVPSIVLVTHRILLVVFLMILLGGIELRGGDDLGYNRTIKPFRRIETLLRRFRRLALGFVVVEDRGTILVAMVAKLGVGSDRIDVVPEDVQQLLIADLGGVVDDLHGLGMT